MKKPSPTTNVFFLMTEKSVIKHKNKNYLRHSDRHFSRIFCAKFKLFVLFKASSKDLTMRHFLTNFVPEFYKNIYIKKSFSKFTFIAKL